MTRREFLVFGASLIAPRCLGLQDKEDFFTGRDVFANLMAKANLENWHQLRMGDLVGKIGLEFIGTPYVGQTFEVFDDREVCVINLKGLDCATFYEAALALARTIKSGRSNEAHFRRQMEFIRYRGGKMRGYESRLHYAIDYFFDNEKKSVLNTVSDELPGAIPFNRDVFYMTRNPGQYRQLKANPTLVAQIAKFEAEINGRKTLFIPKDKVAEIEILLKTGDILGLATTKAGLDVSHTGMCYRDESDVLRFLHASSTKMQVVLDVQLSEYLAKSKVNDGIVIARPLELS